MKKIMKKTIVSTNWLNKVIAIMMMSITFAMPAMAGNKKNNNGKNDKVVVVVNNDKKASHFDKADKKTTVSTSRPTVSTSRSSHFDANKTSARNIKQFVA